MESTIRQYRPAFVTGFKNATVPFKSLSELLEIDFVKNFKHDLFDDESKIDPLFHQFSISVGEERDDYPLMAEYDNGYSWYVVGFINCLDLVRELPVWKPKYKEKNEHAGR